MDCFESYRLLSFIFDRKPAAFVLTTYNPNKHYNHFLLKRNAGARVYARFATRAANREIFALDGKSNERFHSVESAIGTRAVQHGEVWMQNVIHQRAQNVGC